MTRLAILLPTGILASTVLLGAQATSQQPPPDRPTTTTPQPSEPRATTSAEPKAKQVTISGCLKPGTSADTFILTNAGMPAAPSGAAPAAQGTTGSAKSYAVVAKPGTDLSKHVNHKIEVTGTVSAPNSASKPSTAPASETSSVGAAAQPTETFNVDSFKMVAMACP